MSQNIKLGLQYHYQQGKVQVNHNRFLGYSKDADGHLIVDPKQAEIVKRIYREYLEGSSMDKIAAGLMADGILTGAGKTKWHTIADKIFRLRDQMEQSKIDSHHQEEIMNRIKELQDFISGKGTDITEFNETLVKKLIEMITIYADHFTVELKSGITSDIKA